MFQALGSWKSVLLIAGMLAAAGSATRTAEEPWENLPNGVLGQVADFEGAGGVTHRRLHPPACRPRPFPPRDRPARRRPRRAGRPWRRRAGSLEEQGRRGPAGQPSPGPGVQPAPPGFPRARMGRVHDRLSSESALHARSAGAGRYRGRGQQGAILCLCGSPADSHVRRQPRRSCHRPDDVARGSGLRRALRPRRTGPDRPRASSRAGRSHRRQSTTRPRAGATHRRQDSRD